MQVLPKILKKVKKIPDAGSVRALAKLKWDCLFSHVTYSTCICFLLLCLRRKRSIVLFSLARRLSQTNQISGV